MNSKVLKGSIILLILMLFIVSASAAADDEAIDVLTLSSDGITISFPSDWQSSRATSEYSIMAISKLGETDSLGVAKDTINVEKKDIEGDFKTFVNSSYQSMSKDSRFELVSSGDIVIDNRDALEYVYTSLDETGTQKEHKAVWFEKDNKAYVLLYSAPLDQFEANLYVFDYMLSNIQIS